MPHRPYFSAALALALGLLSACAQTEVAPEAATSAVLAPAANSARELALAAVVAMPAADRYEVRYFEWQDEARHRMVAVKLYMPVQGQMLSGFASTNPVPLVVFSHGIGGSREGYTYLGKHWAANGIASMHLQHVGSDRTLWRGNPLSLVSRLQDAASESEAMDRARDLHFALDQLLADPVAQRVDASRIAAAGHSYGANTTLLVAGARVTRDGKALDFSDPRIRAAVILSAPPFYGEADTAGILQNVHIPTLHITAQDDDIRIPGYYSGVNDRRAVFAATGSADKTLVVFKAGSHSMFTDRLGTGGAVWNPQVKTATRDLSLTFLRSVFDGNTTAFEPEVARHQALYQDVSRRH